MDPEPLPFPFRYSHLEPGAFSRFAGLGDRYAGDSKDFLIQGNEYNVPEYRTLACKR